MILVQTSIFVKPTASFVGTSSNNPLAKGRTKQNAAKGKALKNPPASADTALEQSKLRFC
jgi:hypothetical protein